MEKQNKNPQTPTIVKQILNKHAIHENINSFNKNQTKEKKLTQLKNKQTNQPTSKIKVQLGSATLVPTHPHSHCLLFPPPPLKRE